MIGGINGMNSNMSMMNSQSMRQPHGAQAFNRIDSDGDGGINKTELEVFSEKISEKTGKSLDIEEAFSSFDTDGDSTLNSDELKSFIASSGLRPAQPSAQYVLSAYGKNTSDGQKTSLLDSIEGNAEEELSSIFSNESSNRIKTLMDLLSAQLNSEDTRSLVDVNA